MSGAIQQVVFLFKTSFEKLQVEIPPDLLENLAILVDKAMSTETRKYHTLEHVFDLSDTADPIITLAALFHDVVNFQVDGGLIPEVRSIIGNYIHEENNRIILTNGPNSSEPAVILPFILFGMSPGMELTYSMGFNEFLSSLTMDLCLGSLVKLPDLIRINSCIEATIPFRSRNEFGETSFYELARRIDQLNQYYQLHLTRKEIIRIVQKAVVFSNRDVGSFGYGDAARFLRITWKLLPETNNTLLFSEIYNIRDYREALQKMDSFLNTLDPVNVFNYYHGVPSRQELAVMRKAASENIKTGREYLDVQLLTITILEALAVATGGDAPLSMFIGSSRGQYGVYQYFSKKLAGRTPAPDVDTSSPVYYLLETGKAENLEYDVYLSPLTLFIYMSLGSQNINRALESAGEYFNSRIKARQFLSTIDSQVVSAVAAACADLVVTRREALMAFV